MDTLSSLALGLQTVMAPQTLLLCFVGVFLGTFVGVLPGVGAMATISLLLPLTYHVPPTDTIVMLAGIYYGAQYGGSTASILLNLPGTPSSAVTCIDGYQMTLKGRAGVALFITAVASFVGAVIGIALVVLFSPAIAQVGLRFGPAEYFAMMLLGLVAASTLASGSPLKGLSMVVLGLLMGTVGTDINSGQTRFDFGVPELSDGISLVALAMGMFGVAEVIGSINVVQGARACRDDIRWRKMLPTREDLQRAWRPTLRGSAIGSFFGALPGTGPATSSFMAYAMEKRVARDPSRLGQGAVEGIASPEAANNAAAQTAFVPTLTLGIPGDPIMALMMGAFIIHGIQPGPMLMSEHPEMFWALVVSFGIGNLMLLVLNLPLVGLWVSLLRIPYRAMYPGIIIFICMGVYSVHNNTFDVLTVAAVGALGYAMRVLRFEVAPMLLGFVLGPLMEEHLRRAMLLAHGQASVFIERPISAAIMACNAALLLWLLSAPWRRGRTAAA